MTTYTIESRQSPSEWTCYGLGESEGWPSVESAEAAIRSLAALGDEWHGEYRVVEMPGRRPVSEITVPEVQP